MNLNPENVIPKLIGINKIRKNHKIPRPILKESIVEFYEKFGDKSDYHPFKNKMKEREFRHLLDSKFSDFLKILSEKSGIVFSKRRKKNNYNYNFNRPSDAQELGDEWDDYAWSANDF